MSDLKRKRTSIADHLPVGSYLFKSPNRYVFRGAEVYERDGQLLSRCDSDEESDSDNEDEADEESSSSNFEPTSSESVSKTVHCGISEDVVTTSDSFESPKEISSNPHQEDHLYIPQAKKMRIHQS